MNNIKDNLLLEKYIKKEELSIKDIDELSIILKINYCRLISLYLDNNYYYPNKGLIIKMINGNDIEGLKRLIIERNIKLDNNKVLINNMYSNNIPNSILDNKTYNLVLKTLIENNEVDVALMISNYYCRLDKSLYHIQNIEEYLVGIIGKHFPRFIDRIYEELDDDILEKIEPKLKKLYIKSLIEVLKDSFDNNDIYVDEISKSISDLSLDDIYKKRR